MREEEKVAVLELRCELLPSAMQSLQASQALHSWIEDDRVVAMKPLIRWSTEALCQALVWKATRASVSCQFFNEIHAQHGISSENRCHRSRAGSSMKTGCHSVFSSKEMNE